MRFRFRLEPVLKLKEKEEEEAKEELLRVRMEKARIERKIEEVEAEIERAAKAAMEAISQSRVEDLFMWKDYSKLLEKKRKKLFEDLREIEEKEMVAMERFIEKKKEKNSLLKLKDRRFRSFLKEIDSNERKLIDEVALRKFWWGG